MHALRKVMNEDFLIFKNLKDLIYQKATNYRSKLDMILNPSNLLHKLRYHHSIIAFQQRLKTHSDFFFSDNLSDLGLMTSEDPLD